MLNDCNTDNRLRYPVRGRVIVATTSKIVEFIDNKLTYSYPLYSVESIQDGFALVFCVELDGFLTFNEGSQVKITTETAEFEKLHYDPKAFALVRAADSFRPYVVYAYGTRYDYYEGQMSEGRVTVMYAIGQADDAVLDIDSATWDYSKSMLDHFPVNSIWPGMAHLPRGAFNNAAISSPLIP